MDQLPAPAPAPAIPIQGAVFMGDIPSVRDLVPAAPPMLGPFNLNRRVAVGDNLDFEVLINAQGLVDYIRIRFPQLPPPGVNLELLFIVAGLRLGAVQGAFISSLFYPQLIQPLMLDLQQALAVVRAQINQFHVMIRCDILNRSLQVTNRTIDDQGGIILPIRKRLPGHGLALANQLLPENFPPLNNPPLANVGEVPPGFNPDILHYADGEILWLIMFYAETFGIFAQDNLAIRRQKVLRYFIA